MTEIIVDDTTPRKQYPASSGQTTFIYDFPIRVDSDLKVYQRSSGSTANDAADILILTVDYTVTDAGEEDGGTIVLVTGATVNDIITIVRDMPEERTSDFQTGSTLSQPDLNHDLDNVMLMLLQNEMNILVRSPLYPNSAIIDSPDKILPILGAAQVWAKKSDNSAIEAISFSDIHSELGADLASHDVGKGASLVGLQTPSTQTVQDFYNDLSSLALSEDAGFIVRTASETYNTRTLTGAANQITISNPAGTLGNPLFSITDNPIMPGTASMTVPRGTTLERPGAPVTGMIRFDTTLEVSQIYEAGQWNSIIDGNGPSNGAPKEATYITQTSNAILTNAQDLASLNTGLMKSTTSTGVVSTITGSSGITNVSADPNLIENSDLYLSTQRATKTYVDAQVVDTFIELFDTPNTYTTVHALYRVNNAKRAIEETTLTLTQPVSNQFIFTGGSTSLSVLGVSLIDQDVRVVSSPVYVGMTLTDLKTLNGIVQTDGSGVLSTSVTLPDGTFGTTQSLDDNSTKLATTAYVDGSVDTADSFLELDDTPSSYVVANALQKINAGRTALEESGTTLAEPAADEFTFAHGPTALVMQADLSVTGASLIDQDVRIAASPTYSGLTLSSLTTVNGVVQTDGSGVLSSSLTLANGILATTQGALDNSTKLATTAYVDSAVAIEDLWDRAATTLSPSNAGDDVSFGTGGMKDNDVSTAISLGDSSNTVLPTELSSSSVLGSLDKLATMTATNNGAIFETATLAVTSDGATITLSVSEPSTNTLTFKYSDAITAVDVTTPLTIALTEGTKDVPVENFIYTLKAAPGTLVKDSSSFPATEYAPIGRFVVQTEALVQADGVLKQHNYTDHLSDENDQGHITEINDWIRSQHATWISGVEPIFSGSGTPLITMASSPGVVKQLHNQVFPTFTDPTTFYIINHFVTPYTQTVNLGGGILADATGASLSNKSYNLVLFAVASEGGSGESKWFVNLPGGSYNNIGQAEADASKFSDFSIPTEFVGTAFLVWKLLIRNSGFNYTITSTTREDLRGLFPNTDAGSTTSIGTTFSDASFNVFNNANNTKVIAFDASAISTGTTRTYIFPDTDSSLLVADGTQLLTANWDAGSFEIRAQTLEADVTTGTAPFTITSTTVVPNLNVDKVDGFDLDQAVLIGSSPTHVGMTLSGLNTVNGIVQTDGSGVLSTSTTLPNGTLATTQSASDNSTKLATTAYVEAAVATKDTFLELSDTPASYVVAGALQMINAGRTALEESGTTLLEPAADEFIFEHGGTMLTMVGSLEVEANTIVNQDLTTDADPSWNTMTSTVSIGTPPLTVTSTTLVTNLHADLLDSQEGSYYQALVNATGPSLTIGDGTAENTKVVFDGNAQDYYVGLDDADDSVKIGLGSTVGTTPYMIFNSSGIITKPLQPSFFAYLSGNVLNVTGDGTNYTIAFDSEIWDLNADFDTGTATFTAPVTTKYIFCLLVNLDGVLATHTECFLTLVASNRTIVSNVSDPGNYFSTVSNELSLETTVTLDMDAGDTLTTTVFFGGATKVVDVKSNGATDPRTTLSGTLLV